MTQNPPDMRYVVESNRGLTKKIELAIPGFRGYRQKEDLRIADNLLRIHLADRMSRVCSGIEEVKRVASKKLDLNLVSVIGGVENALRVLEKRLRHAEQGYSGISPDYKMDDMELHTLYNYDSQLLANAGALEQGLASLQSQIISWNVGEIERQSGVLMALVKDVERIIDGRREAILAAVGVRR